MFEFLLRVRFLARQLSAAVVALAVLGSAAQAQVTPIVGAINGSEGASREHTIDDILRDAIQAHQTDAAAGKASPAVTTFALGRVRSSDHESFRNRANAALNSVAYDSDEASIFAALAYRAPGFHANSRFSVAAYFGHTSLDTDLGAHPVFYAGQRHTGTSENDALLGGVTMTYSVGNAYLAGAFTYFNGETEVNQTTGGLATLGTAFDTSGYMFSAAIGNSFEVGKISGVRTFVNLEAGFRHVDTEGDRFANRGLTAEFEPGYISSVGSLTLGLFAVMPVGNMTARPFTRLTLLHDLDYENTQDIYQFGILQETDHWSRRANTAQVEAGVNVTSGSFNLSVSGFTEWAADQNTVGGKFGVRYDF